MAAPRHLLTQGMLWAFHAPCRCRVRQVVRNFDHRGRRYLLLRHVTDQPSGSVLQKVGC